MSAAPDGKDLRLPEAKVCEIVGVSQSFRQSLVKRGMLEAVPAGGCGRVDAVELAAIDYLRGARRPSDLALAWKQLRPQLRGIVPTRRLDLIFDRQLGSTTIARNDQELRVAVATGRPVHVFDLGARLHEVIDAFTRWGQVAPPQRAQRARSARSRRAS